MAQPPGFDEAAARLEEATFELERAIEVADKAPKDDPWRKRLDDLGLLKEQVIDIRQQLELLKLEIPRETAKR